MGKERRMTVEPIKIVMAEDDLEDQMLVRKAFMRSYRLGANSYIQKPVTFEKMVEIVDGLGQYWRGIVKLPPNGG
jgi:hypothetical protein